MKLLAPDLKESLVLWKKAEGLIPAGTQTLSKVPNRFVEGVFILYLLNGARDGWKPAEKAFERTY